MKSLGDYRTLTVQTKLLRRYQSSLAAGACGSTARLAPLLVNSARLSQKLLVLAHKQLPVEGINVALEACRSSSPVLGLELEAHHDWPIPPRQESRIVLQSKCSQGVQGMNVVDDVEMRADHVAILVVHVLCERLAGVASALQLLQHGADDLLHASLCHQCHVAGKEDHAVGLGRGDVEVIHDCGDVCQLLVILHRSRTSGDLKSRQRGT